MVPVAIYKPFLRLAFFAGVGAEISRAETIAMTRLGASKILGSGHRISVGREMELLQQLGPGLYGIETIGTS